jgi:predicted DNA-binding transcriptional regulator AlpA
MKRWPSGLEIVGGFREAAELTGLHETGVRGRQRDDIFFPGSIDWGSRSPRWYRSQLIRWLALRHARRTYRTAVAERVRPLRNGRPAEVDEWEGLHRVYRWSGRAYEGPFFETDDGVYRLDSRSSPGPPRHSLMDNWVLSCRGIPVAEGAVGFGQAREVLRELRRQDRGFRGPPTFHEIATLPLDLHDDTDDVTRPAWAEGVAGQIIGEGLRIVSDSPDTPDVWGLVLNAQMSEIDAVPMRTRSETERRLAKRLVSLAPGPEAYTEDFRDYLKAACLRARRSRQDPLLTIRAAVLAYSR